MNTTEHIRQRALASPEGVLISANELLAFGSRDAVDAALSRLARRGELLRVEQGRYVSPVRTRYGVRAPEVEAVVRAWGRSHFVPVEPSGAAAANGLGMTTQVPVESVWLTTGSSSVLTVGHTRVELRNAPTWKVLPGHAGAVIRALDWLGPESARSVWPQVRQGLSAEVAAELLASRSVVPTWLAELFTALEVS